MKFKPGTYWIGDLCYVTEKSVWDKICEELDPSEDSPEILLTKENEYLGKTVFVDETTYGDGSYPSNVDVDFIVDSGTLGICPIELAVKKENLHLGYIIIFDQEFDVVADNGFFSFGNKVEIDTRDDSFDDEDEDEENDEDCGEWDEYENDEDEDSEL